MRKKNKRSQKTKWEQETRKKVIKTLNVTIVTIIKGLETFILHEYTSITKKRPKNVLNT